MAEGISVTGNKKIETLKKEFTSKYPYLKLLVCPMSEKEKAEKGLRISQVDTSLTIANVRTKVAPGNITITGNKLVKTLEKEFEDIFGLYVQVAHTNEDGRCMYSTLRGGGDNMTLSAYNKKREEQGDLKDKWE